MLFHILAHAFNKVLIKPLHKWIKYQCLAYYLYCILSNEQLQGLPLIIYYKSKQCLHLWGRKTFSVALDHPL